MYQFTDGAPLDPGKLTLAIDGVKRKIQADKLLDQEFADALREECAAAKKVTVWAARIPAVDYRYLEFAVRVLHTLKVTHWHGAPGATTLLDALLKVKIDATKTGDDTLSGLRQACLTAAVVACPTSPGKALDRIQKRLHELGVKPEFSQLKHLRAIFNQILAEKAWEKKPAALARTYLAYVRRRLGKAAPAEDRPVLCYHSGLYYLWAGTHWVERTKQQIEDDVLAYHDSSGQRTNTEHRNNVVANVRSQVTLQLPDDLALPLWVEGVGEYKRRNLLNLTNGMLDLDAVMAGAEAKLLPHDPRWLSTEVLPYGYDPEATCPRFVKFLNEVLPPESPDDRRRHLIAEWLGYCLMADAPYHKFLILFGEGANGKGVLLRLISELLGADNVSAVPLEHFDRRFALAAMVGKKANLVGDLNEVDSVAEGTLKKFTGMDPVDIDRKFLPMLRVVPTTKLFFAANTLPHFTDRTDGVWRRTEVVPFTVQVKPADRDPHLNDKLREELPGILKLALRAMKFLRERGRFIACEVCAGAVAKYRKDCDPVAQFVEEGCRVKPHLTVPKQDLYATYVKWCGDTGRKPLSMWKFNRQIEKVGGVKDGGRPRRKGMPAYKRPRVWKGITA